MAAKISALVTLALSATSLLTWGGISANNKYQHQKKMEKYAKYWEEFYDKASNDSMLKDQLCSSVDMCQKYRSYLPKPDEYEYWLESYESLEANNTSSSNTVSLNNIKSPDELMDYCYSKVKEELSNELAYTNSSSGWFTHCSIIPKK